MVGKTYNHGREQKTFHKSSIINDGHGLYGVFDFVAAEKNCIKPQCKVVGFLRNIKFREEKLVSNRTGSQSRVVDVTLGNL
jgi:hypothetical protein